MFVFIVSKFTADEYKTSSVRIDKRDSQKFQYGRLIAPVQFDPRGQTELLPYRIQPRLYSTIAILLLTFMWSKFHSPADDSKVVWSYIG